MFEVNVSLNPGGPPYHGEEGTVLAVVLDGEKDVKLWGRIEDGVIRFERMEVVAATEITTDILRSVPLGEIRLEIAAKIRQPKPGFWMEPIDSGVRLRRFGVDYAEEAGTRLGPHEGYRGRPPLPAGFLRRVAERYLQHCREHPESPMKALTETFRSDKDQPDDLSPDTVKTWVRLAANRGWLIRTGGRGKAGGEPGPLLVQAWDEEGNEA